MPLLLTESLDPVRREHTHQHIESCSRCGDEWTAYQETWRLLEELPQVEVPARVKERFLAQIAPEPAKPKNVIPFQRRPAFKWIAQAAAVVVIAGGAYFAGNRIERVEVKPTPATIASVTPVSTMPQYSIAESRVLPASMISPTIEGRPDISNVQFDRTSTSDEQITLAFDITSRVTVTGRPTDKSMVRLMRYVLENEDRLGPSRSRAIDWVRATYSRPGNGDPEITAALANVLRNDEHQGVRIKAADTLRTLQPSSIASAADTRSALIEALKSDPNPAVRIKAVEALAKLARSGAQFDEATLETLRMKSLQGDENNYIRMKAAEALTNVKP